MALNKGDQYVQLAIQSYEHYVTTGQMLPLPENLPQEMLKRQAGAFVSLHLGGYLRGCIGTISPVRENLALEIIHNAVSAAVRDPRFIPVRKEELPNLTCSVDVLGPAEEIRSLDQLDVKKYGVIVSRGNRLGLLLPNLDGIDTVEEQVEIARQKAGILRDEPVRLQRFEVVRHI